MHEHGQIWKYELTLTGLQIVHTPRASHFVDFRFQGEVLCLWLYVDAPTPVDEVEFFILGTGTKTLGLDFGDYLATTHHDGFVWHLFSKMDLK